VIPRVATGDDGGLSKSNRCGPELNNEARAAGIEDPASATDSSHPQNEPGTFRRQAGGVSHHLRFFFFVRALTICAGATRINRPEYFSAHSE